MKFFVKVPCAYLGTGETTFFETMIEAENEDEAIKEGEMLAIYHYERRGYDVGLPTAQPIENVK